MKNYKKELTNAQQDVIAETQGCLKEIAVEVNDIREQLDATHSELCRGHVSGYELEDIESLVVRLQALYDSLT